MALCRVGEGLRDARAGAPTAAAGRPVAPPRASFVPVLFDACRRPESAFRHGRSAQGAVSGADVDEEAAIGGGRAGGGRRARARRQAEQGAERGRQHLAHGSGHGGGAAGRQPREWGGGERRGERPALLLLSLRVGGGRRNCRLHSRGGLGERGREAGEAARAGARASPPRGDRRAPRSGGRTRSRGRAYVRGGECVCVCACVAGGRTGSGPCVGGGRARNARGAENWCRATRGRRLLTSSRPAWSAAAPPAARSSRRSNRGRGRPSTAGGARRFRTAPLWGRPTP